MHVYTCIDTLCSLRLMPNMHTVGITMDCGGQCSLISNYQNDVCVNLFNELGIQQCNQTQCSPRVYNLCACNTEAGIITTTAEKPQTSTPTICRNKIINRTVTTVITVTTANQPRSIEAQDISCTPTPTPSKIPTPPNSTINTSSVAVALGALVALLMLLLIAVTTALVWTSWKLKTKEEGKSLLRQSR